MDPKAELTIVKLALAEVEGKNKAFSGVLAYAAHSSAVTRGASTG
jgi:hypothetical protein